MNEIEKRQTVETLYDIKLKSLGLVERLEKIDENLNKTLEPLHGYVPYRLEWRFENYDEDRAVKYFDRAIWRYFVKLCNLEKYMLCTEYEKLQADIEQFKTPVFNPENAQGWLDNLKSMIYENVRLMCKRVYDSLLTGTYRTGGWNTPKKKRNNAGVDKRFILTTNDYSRIFGYYYNRPTITDDLEKVCYILGGKTLPEKTIITQARDKKLSEIDCGFFSVKFYQNGNTHYLMTDETRNRLNLIGPTGNIIGEDIKIKIFE